MSKPIIEIKNLSKAYMIGHEQQAAVGTMTFRDTLTSLAKKPIELFTGHKLKKEKFWALNDISLDVEQGDIVGIVGRNGSGKSTLLKVLSRIVEPTKGEIIMRGRVASLLEVGTGFHPELTGRENVFFNGAILGMGRREIREKFDEIVAFSEVEKFLDTPVKFYSSGMYVRLAFAVAAHLDPDILIVDEVLAVGDAAFQKKSLGKMKDVAGQGRTVLFVSHSMSAVRSLCNKGALMKDGELKFFGAVGDALAKYEEVSEATLVRKKADNASYITKLETRPKTGKGALRSGGTLEIVADIHIAKQDIGKELVIGFGLDDGLHNRLDTFVSEWQGLKVVSKKSKVRVICSVERVQLAAGTFYVSSSLSRDGFTSDYIDGGIAFVVEASSKQHGAQRLSDHGALAFDYSMKVENV